MAKVSVRCSIPGTTNYHMLYNDLTIEESDYGFLEGLEGDRKIAAMQFLATRQMFMWHVAIGFFTPEEFATRMALITQMLPEDVKEAVLHSSTQH